MKKEKVEEIIDKIIVRCKKKISKGATLDREQLDWLKNILLLSPYDDGCQRITVMTEKGENTHLVPFEDIILKSVAGKQILKYPVDIK